MDYLPSAQAYVWTAYSGGTIQKLMGHARIRTTEIYLHISDSQVQADYEAAMEQIMERLSPQEGLS